MSWKKNIWYASNGTWAWINRTHPERPNIYVCAYNHSTICGRDKSIYISDLMSPSLTWASLRDPAEREKSEKWTMQQNSGYSLVASMKMGTGRYSCKGMDIPQADDRSYLHALIHTYSQTLCLKHILALFFFCVEIICLRMFLCMPDAARGQRTGQILWN